jgi:hypothetical protein
MNGATLLERTIAVPNGRSGSVPSLPWTSWVEWPGRTAFGRARGRRKVYETSRSWPVPTS